MSGRERRITISSKAVGGIEAVMTDENPNTPSAVWNALPIKAKPNRWGEEIYFSTPISPREENARQEVAVGNPAYWQVLATKLGIVRNPWLIRNGARCPINWTNFGDSSY